MADFMQPKMPRPLPGLGTLPGLGPLPGLPIEELAAQSRRKRKQQEMEDKVAGLEGVVTQLGKENVEVRREMDAFHERMQLLERVFMFVDFDKLQKVADKLGKLHVDSEEDLSSAGIAEVSNAGAESQSVKARVLEHFPSCGALSTTSEESQEKASEAIASAKRRNKDKTRGGAVPSGTEDGAKVEVSKAADVPRQSSPPTCVTKEDDAESKHSKPRSKAQALRGVMAARTPPLAGSSKDGAESDPGPSSKTRNSGYGSATGTATAAAARSTTPRSKSFEFAEKYRQRYGQDSTLPTFIYERLGQDGMTDEEINNIGRTS